MASVTILILHFTCEHLIVTPGTEDYDEHRHDPNNFLVFEERRRAFSRACSNLSKENNALTAGELEILTNIILVPDDHIGAVRATCGIPANIIILAAEEDWQHWHSSIFGNENNLIKVLKMMDAANQLEFKQLLSPLPKPECRFVSITTTELAAMIGGYLRIPENRNLFMDQRQLNQGK